MAATLDIPILPSHQPDSILDPDLLTQVEAAMSTPPIFRVPLHVLGVVLSHLDSIKSLGSAVLSHSLLYAAFNDKPNGIISDIITSQIPPETMAYAVAAYEASSVDGGDLEQISAFLLYRFYFAGPYEIRQYRFRSGQLNPSVASALSRTHTIVQHFARDLVQDTLPFSREQLAPERPNHGRVSASEEFRIYRALYRFQVYCTLLFSDKKHFHPDRERKRLMAAVLQVNFFNYFSPWVNEQLACIHDYLERVLSRAFDEIAAHEVQWGYKCVDWLSTGKHSEHKQAYLSCGLHFLFALDQAKSYGERLAIFRTKGKSPPHTEYMLASHFKYSGVLDDPHDPQYLLPFEEWTEHSLEFLSNQTTDGPGDGFMSGPCRMWLEAHKPYHAWDATYSRWNPCLRRCGYVLWDAPDAPLDDETLGKRLQSART